MLDQILPTSNIYSSNTINEIETPFLNPHPSALIQNFTTSRTLNSRAIFRAALDTSLHSTLNRAPPTTIPHTHSYPSALVHTPRGRACLYIYVLLFTPREEYFTTHTGKIGQLRAPERYTATSPEPHTTQIYGTLLYSRPPLPPRPAHIHIPVCFHPRSVPPNLKLSFLQVIWLRDFLRQWWWRRRQPERLISFPARPLTHPLPSLFFLSHAGFRSCVCVCARAQPLRYFSR